MENKPIPHPQYLCGDNKTFSTHHSYAKYLYWYDDNGMYEGEEFRESGWYCTICYPGGYPPAGTLTLEEELENRGFSS